MADKIATRQAYGEALIELVEKNDKVVVLDADLANATQTCKVAKAHPEKFYNCGIAEANMVDIAAGMSTMGLIPYCSSFAMFAAGRAYEQIRNSIAYPHFNVKICATHAGVSVGEDGGSHQCIEDIALMRVIPGMTVICPADANEAKAATMAIAEMNGPVYMRLARLATPVFEGDMVKPFEIGKANVLREGKDVAIFATGLMVSESLAAAEKLAKEGIDAAVINIHTIKPIDAECVTKYAVQCGKVITVEEHSVIGGLGDAVADVLMGKVNCKFHKIGVNDRFGQSGKAADVLREYGLTADQIAAFGGRNGILRSCYDRTMSLLMIGTVKNDLFAQLESAAKSAAGSYEFKVINVAAGSQYTIFMLTEERFWGLNGVEAKSLSNGVSAYDISVMW